MTMKEKFVITKKSIYKEWLKQTIEINQDKIKTLPENRKKIYMAKLKNNIRYQVRTQIKGLYGFQSSTLNLIYLDLTEIKQTTDIRIIKYNSDKCKYDFYNLVIETLSHEIIHSVLENIENFDTSKQYDNIYRKLRKYDIYA